MAGLLKKITGKKNTDAPEKKKARGTAVLSEEHSADVVASPENAATQTASAVGLGSAKFIIKPLITEKGTFAAEHNTYLFQVALNANKRAIKEAVEKLYKVKVVSVNTARFKGKVVRYGRVTGRRSDFKKAFIQVAKGQSITIHKHV